MKLTDKRFWIYEIATALCLSAFSLTFYSDSIFCILLILLSNALAVAIGLIWPKNIGVLYTWLWVWGAAIGAYLVDVTLMVIFNMTIHEPYPLIVVQIYLLPSFILVSGVLCFVGWIIMSKTYKRTAFKAISTALLSIIGAIGAAANINIGKNVVPFVIFIGFALVGCVLFHKSLKDIQGKSPVDLRKFRKAKYEAWRDGKTNQVPLSSNDYLYGLRQIFPFMMVGLFILSCALFGLFSSDRSNEWNVKGLVGNVSDLYIFDDGKGIAISSLRYMDHPDTATVYLTENGGRKWDLFIELPGYGKAFNTVRINDDVYCAIQHHSAYEIERINHEGSNWWSDYKFAKLPILFAHNDSLCYAANGIFYRTDRYLKEADSIGYYSLQPANKGLAVVQNHIFGFTFYQSPGGYRLYDFTADSYIADFSCKGDVSLIKSSSNTCVILTQTGGELESYLLDCSTGTVTNMGQFDFGMMEALRSEGDVLYSLVTKRPNTDSYILYSFDAGKTWNTQCINESNIRAYCLHNGYLYFYNQFMHTICRQKLEIKNL
mgnify:FL=1